MVATVGSISIDLAVKSAAFEAGFKRAGSTVERESSRMSKATAAASKSINSLSSVAARFGGALGGAFAGREIIRYADAWTEAGNKIRAAGEMAGRQGRSLRELNDIATETRSGLGETVDLYSKLLLATQKVAKSETEVAKATEIVNKAFKAGGASASEQAAGILQLSQALASGVLQGDELRSLRENAFVLAKAIADEFGVTVGQLKELGAAGALEIGRVFKAILGAEKDIDAAFAQTNATIGDGLTRIKNAGTELIGTLSEVTGGAGSLSGELQGFASEIERMSDAISEFAENPSVRNFFEKLLGAKIEEGSLVDQIRDGIVGKDFAELEREIAKVTEEITLLQAAKDKLPEGDPSLSVFTIEISNAKQRLIELNGEVDALRREADDAAVAVGGLGDEINRLQDKDVTINVRTNVSSLPKVNSLGGVDLGTIALTNPIGLNSTGSKKKTIDPLGNHQTFAEGGFTGNVPADRVAGIVHGGEFVFDAEATRKIGVENLEAIRRGVQGYEAGGAVGTVAALTSGRDKLSAIEDNTFQTAENTVRSIGYLETLVKDGQTMLAELRLIEAAIGDIEINVPASSSGGGGSFDDGMSVSSGGGFSSGTSSGGSSGTFSSSDPRSPYFFNANLARPGGATYDPIADAFLNGNVGALRNLSADQIGSIYTAQTTNIGGSFQDTQAMLDALIKGAGGGFADGGIAFRPSIFGEAGPEAAVPLPDGRSIPVTLSGGGGDAHVTINYHAAPGNPDPSPRAMMELRDMIRQTVLSVNAGL